MALKKVTEDITSYGNLIDETTGGSSRTFLAGTYTTNKGGTVILYENGDYIYTPPADLYGSDYFFYTQYKTNNKGVVTESSVKGAFSITSVNDIPVAVDDKFSTKESTVLTGNVLQDNGHGADHDVETATLKAVAGTFATTQGGSVKITSTGNFTYTPPAGFHGIDSFTYQAKDGANATDTGNVTIIVKSVIDVIATVTDNQYSAPDDQDYRINGLNTADVIVGGAGNDIIQGFAGVDNIQGGSGDDEIHGGSGDDTIYGDDGNDTLLGEGGADIIYGGAGDDFIGGDVGFTAGMNDMLYGGDGNDTIEGRAGDDTIEAAPETICFMAASATILFPAAPTTTRPMAMMATTISLAVTALINYSAMRVMIRSMAMRAMTSCAAARVMMSCMAVTGMMTSAAMRITTFFMAMPGMTFFTAEPAMMSCMAG